MHGRGLLLAVLVLIVALLVLDRLVPIAASGWRWNGYRHELIHATGHPLQCDFTIYRCT